MADGTQNRLKSTLQDKISQFRDQMTNQSRIVGRFLTPKNLVIGASMLGGGLMAGCDDSSTSPHMRDQGEQEEVNQQAPADSVWVYRADEDMYRRAHEKVVLGCEDTEFEAYSLTGEPFDSIDYLTKDTCGPINPSGSTSIGDDLDDLVGFSALIRINDDDPDVAQMQYISCYPRGGRLMLSDGQPDFESIECYVDENKSEWSRNAVGIRGTIYGVDFDAGPNNNWKVDAQDMDFADKKTVPVFTGIQDEKFSCEAEAAKYMQF